MHHMHAEPTEARRGAQIHSLKPELHMVVSYHVGTGNYTLVLWKSSQSP